MMVAAGLEVAATPSSWLWLCSPARGRLEGAFAACGCVCVGRVEFMRGGWVREEGGRRRVSLMLHSLPLAACDEGEGRLVWVSDQAEAREALQSTHLRYTPSRGQGGARGKKQNASVALAHIFEFGGSVSCALPPPFFISLNQWLREPLLLVLFLLPFVPFGLPTTHCPCCCSCLGRQLLAHLRGSKLFGTSGIDGGESSFSLPHMGTSAKKACLPASSS